jgi:hypothetical protein
MIVDSDEAYNLRSGASNRLIPDDQRRRRLDNYSYAFDTTAPLPASHLVGIITTIGDALPDDL